jgi:hypothetical protein
VLKKLSTARTCKWEIKLIQDNKTSTKSLLLQLGAVRTGFVGIRVDGRNNIRMFVDYGGVPGTGTWKLSGFDGQLGPFAWDPYFLDTKDIKASIWNVRPETLALVKYYCLQWAAKSSSGREFDSASLDPLDTSHLKDALRRLTRTEKFQEITTADPFFNLDSEDEDMAVGSDPGLPRPYARELLHICTILCLCHNKYYSYQTYFSNHKPQNPVRNPVACTSAYARVAWG